MGASPGAALLVLLCLVLTLPSAASLARTLCVWEQDRPFPGARAPRTFATPSQRFTLVLTVSRDAAGVVAAIKRLVALHYPRDLVQVLVVLDARDTGSIGSARAALAALLCQGIRTVRLLIVGDPPFNRPHALNVGLRAATGDIVAVVDSGDELHPDILNVVNTVVAREGAASTPVVCCEGRPGGSAARWPSLLNGVERSSWLWALRQYQAAAGVAPLGGGTVFIRRDLVRRLGGWDERCSAEDAALAIRLTAERVPLRLVAGHDYATRSLGPATLAQRIRQRARRHRGYLRLVVAGDWRRLPSASQRLLALSTLISPLLLPLTLLYVPVGVWLLLSGRLPAGAAMVSSLPLYLLLLQVLAQVLRLRERPRLGGRALAERRPSPRAEVGLVLLLLAIALLAHGTNLFDSAAARDDEGLNTARAWAALREQRLAPATGGYDQPPAGWLLLAGWMGATGGPLTFGDALDSGRAGMLVLHLGMVVLLYRLARKLGCGPLAAALACVLFSVSPLAVFYQRLVMLDTIMLFWALLSLDLVLDPRRRLSRLALGGACFGVACLSQERAVVLAPALLLVVWQGRRERVALVGWLAPLLVVLSWYPLDAALNGDLLPLMRGWATAGASLADGWRWQTLLDSGGAPGGDSGLWSLVRHDWSARDPILLVGGALATAVNLLRGAPGPARDPRALAAGFLAVLPLLDLGRASVVIDYQVLDAVPFLCLSLAVLLAPLLAQLQRTVAASVAVLVVSALAAGYWQAGTLPALYAQRPGAASREAAAWIKQNLPPASRIVAPSYLWTDLREPSPDGPAFANADSPGMAVAAAPASGGLDPVDWLAADYLVVAPPPGGRAADAAPAAAHLVKRWQHDDAAIELWRVGGSGATEAALLARSACYIAGQFERAGAYVGPDGSVSSEGQADALLRAVWSGDRAAFDRGWGWTARHMLRADGLPAWLWRNGAIVDPHSASDADVDLALALLMAGRLWREPALVEDGTRLVQAIWQREVVLVAGAPAIAAGEWAADEATGLVPFNPSYFAPYAYRVFQEVDPAHDWSAVVDSGYQTLFALARAPLGGGQAAGLPPDWVGMDRVTGAVAPLATVGTSDMTVYGYDAPRTYWRLALDLRWSGDARARAYLGQAGLLDREVRLRGAPGSSYTHAGTLVDSHTSMVGTAGALAALLTLDPAEADALYSARVLGSAQAAGAAHEGAAWADRTDLYDQSWGWFATALYADALRDLWHAA